MTTGRISRARIIRGRPGWVWSESEVRSLSLPFSLWHFSCTPLLSGPWQYGRLGPSLTSLCFVAIMLTGIELIYQ